MPLTSASRRPNWVEAASRAVQISVFGRTVHNNARRPEPVRLRGCAMGVKRGKLVSSSFCTSRIAPSSARASSGVSTANSVSKGSRCPMETTPSALFHEPWQCRNGALSRRPICRPASMIVPPGMEKVSLYHAAWASSGAAAGMT
ncbi:hypothetical protein D3C86_1829810 [compost metagenome]